MENSNFKLEFTEMFWATFENALDHIENKIHNPQARNALFIETMNAIDKRLPFADSFASVTVQSKTKSYNIYHIKINNFYVFYEIKKKNETQVMEVQRFAFGGMNLNGLL